MVCHSTERIDRVVYFGEERLDEYCAVSGRTLYSGKTDAEVTLKSPVTQLRSFRASASNGGAALVAAGMSRTGEVQILDGLTLVC